MKHEQRSKMVISSAWLQVAILTFILGFGVLGYLAIRLYHEQPPIPQQVVNENGQVLFTDEDILRGQHVFQKYGLMQHGSVFGHGAYLGPDFTAQYLHETVERMPRFYAGGSEPTAEIRERVERELKENGYDEESGTLTFSAGQARLYQDMIGFYTDWFGPTSPQGHLRPPRISDRARSRR